mmetsp:Transcript_127738/g.318975  ORF Transcript_127738/g.318975 Transcript_127738/m.318975 type:complete len:271 (-) Transcript_127738:17-829(-)
MTGQEARTIEGIDHEGLGLRPRADHHGRTVPCEDGASELHPAPPAATPRSVRARLAGVPVLAHRGEDQEHRTPLEVGRDGLNRLRGAPHFGGARVLLDLRHGAIVDPDVHLAHGRPVEGLLLAHAEGPVEPMRVHGDLAPSLHHPLEQPLQAAEVLTVRIGLCVRQPLVRDADDAHVLRPLAEVAPPQEHLMRHQALHIQQVLHRHHVHRVLRLESQTARLRARPVRHLFDNVLENSGTPVNLQPEQQAATTSCARERERGLLPCRGRNP